MSINLEIVLNTRYLCPVMPLAVYIKLYIFKISFLNDLKMFLLEFLKSTKSNLWKYARMTY